MPSDAVSLTEAPPEAIVWLLKGKLSPEAAENIHGVRWHPKSERVLFPVYNRAGKIDGVLGRAVFGQSPKYVASKGGLGLYFPRNNTADSLVTVVCEDILSAINIADAGYFAAASLGTSLSSTEAYDIANAARTVIGFFDPDRGGDIGYTNLRKRMGLYPVQTVRAYANKDPKHLSRVSLQEAINDALRRTQRD